MFGDQRMKTRDPIEPLRQPFRSQLLAGLAHQMDVVMGFGLVIAHEHFHGVPPRLWFNM